MNTSDAVQQLLDLEAIRTLKHRYIRCMTQSRWDELETLLAPGVEASFSDRASLMGFLRQQDPAGVPQLSYWHVTMPEITLHAPDRASGIWAMYHLHLRKIEQQQLEMFAYYRDEYRKVDGRWLIARTGYERVMEQSLDRSSLPGLQLLVG
jgi:hypothetical protein